MSEGESLVQQVGYKDIKPLTIVPKGTPGQPMDFGDHKTFGGIGAVGLKAFRNAIENPPPPIRTGEPAPKGTLMREGQNTFNREVTRSPADGTFRPRDQFENNWETFSAPMPKKVKAKDLEEGEKIKSAAVAYGDKVYIGPNHMFTALDIADANGIDIEKVLADVNNPKVLHAADGFITTKGRFVDRSEALAIANGTNQNRGPEEGWAARNFRMNQDRYEDPKKRGIASENVKGLTGHYTTIPKDKLK